MLRKLQPTAVIESGLWRGQGTWLIEQACPDADLYCIDLDLDRLEYRSPRAAYSDRDFTKGDWSALPRESTVLFFDDHQNAAKRTKMAGALRFRHLIFDDNYPAGRGDCRSLKQVLSRSQLFGGGVRDALAVYSEFPPVFNPRAAPPTADRAVATAFHGRGAGLYLDVLRAIEMSRIGNWKCHRRQQVGPAGCGSDSGGYSAATSDPSTDVSRVAAARSGTAARVFGRCIHSSVAAMAASRIRPEAT
jgi:hypothetical protein